MPRLIAPVLSALALISTPSLAQETIPLDSQYLETQPLDAQPPAPQPLEIQPSASQSVPAGPVLRESHGDWDIRCIGEADCFMTQLHKGAPETADAVFTVVKLDGLADNAGNAVDTIAEIAVPLGVFLPGGMGLKIDDGPAQAAPYERCISEGCVVRAPITAEMVQQMKRGARVSIVIFGAPEKSVTLPFSLTGFTAAYNAL